jgi:hypothetical protein
MRVGRSEKRRVQEIMMTLGDLSDQALTGRLLQIRKEERRLLVECLGCLAELDRRKTVLSLGYGRCSHFAPSS